MYARMPCDRAFTSQVSLQQRYSYLKVLSKSFYEDIVASSALTVHADSDPILFQYTDEILTGVLIALVCVHYFRFAFTQCISNHH